MDEVTVADREPQGYQKPWGVGDISEVELREFMRETREFMEAYRTQIRTKQGYAKPFKIRLDATSTWGIAFAVWFLLPILSFILLVLAALFGLSLPIF